jgi:hypothetical protein
MWIDFFEMIFASQWILIPFCITEQCRLDYGKHCSIHQTLSPQAFSYTLNPWCVKIKGSPLAISLDSLEWNSEPTLHQIEVVSITNKRSSHNHTYANPLLTLVANPTYVSWIQKPLDSLRIVCIVHIQSLGCYLWLLLPFAHGH